MAKTAKPKVKKNTTLDFDKSLILFNYFLAIFNSENFEQFKVHFANEELENIDDEGRSGFIKKIISENLYNPNLITDSQLLQYDENIIKHTKTINRKRSKKISWKYFQYLTLLFTEIYLDQYFDNRENLKNNLNMFLNQFLLVSGLPLEGITQYTNEDLAKIAFWNATGSGKTLILHINILQYKHYMTQSGRYKVNKFILLTPNEGLSAQHLAELEQSDIDAEIFSGTTNSLFSEAFKIEIIEITKIKKDKSGSGGKTFDISAFGNNNLLLVDEGHRGSSGKEWKDIREIISADGFVFEYSATFGQAIKEGDKDLKDEYVKCILFDYSYRFFYHDFYGKDYKILNITDDSDEDRKKLYLTASLLSFYQQIKLYKSNPDFNKEFNIENPLMLFVGNSVNAVRKEDKKDVSDVLDIILFINFFTAKQSEVKEHLSNILNGNTGFLNSKGVDIFANKFGFLSVLNYDTERVYNDMLKEIFNCSVTGAILHIENIKKADGEIGLKFGDNDYFGVINIGDTAEFLKLCAAQNLHCSVNEFDETEFHKINKPNSTINILIGSKKFTEGWSSWRVSSIGLMNVGQSQGSQIIQLFGRGVRLKGRNYSLKRSSGLNSKDFILRSEYTAILETLNIFGVRANYMAEFRKYLESEGLPVENQMETIKLPVILSDKYNKKIKVLRVKEGLSFKKDAPNPVLASQNFTVNSELYERFRKSISARPAVLDLYTKADVIESKKTKADLFTKESFKIPQAAIRLFDFDRIFFEIQEYKNQKSLFNLNIDKYALQSILEQAEWYELYCKATDLKVEIANLRKIENIAISLLKKYIDRYYTFEKSDWEKDKLEYAFIDEDKKSMKNFISEYEIDIEDTDIVLINYLKGIKAEIEKDKAAVDFTKLDFSKTFSNNFQLLHSESNLYNPLIFTSKKSTVKVKPVSLNEGEKLFVESLKLFVDIKPVILENKELYLLRNQVGALGFFEEGNFYPDFILWLIDGDKQYINFIDPKGIREEGMASAKIGLATKIKEHEKRLNDKNIVLNSFILSVTAYKELEFLTKFSIKEYNDQHVFFLTETMEKHERIESMGKMFSKMFEL